MKYIFIILSCVCLAAPAISQDIPESNSGSTLESIPEETDMHAMEELASSLLLEYEVIRTGSFQGGKKFISQTDLDSMSSIAMQINQSAPYSFSASYVQFREAGYTETGFSHLKQAEALTSNKSELYSDFIATAHILNKSAEFKEYSKKLRSSGFIQSSVLEYNRNVLRSISENKAFIITNGWDDTYPLLTLLDEEKKKNINVINMEWLFDANFRAKIAGQLGTSNPAFSNNPYNWISTISKSSNQNIYFTPTLPNSELTKISGQITPVGILFKLASLTAEEQNFESLKAWKKFSKVNITSSHPISKNYIILLTLLESSLNNDANESGTLAQIQEFKTLLEQKHPSLK